MFQAVAPLLPFITTEIEIWLETLMRKFVKGREIEAADALFKIAKLNALETAVYGAGSEMDIGF